MVELFFLIIHNWLFKQPFLFNFGWQPFDITDIHLCKFGQY